MSFMDTDGRSPCFLTRAQNLAITRESAPSSSKKWLSTDRESTFRTSARTSAKARSAGVVASMHPSRVTAHSADPTGASLASAPFMLDAIETVDHKAWIERKRQRTAALQNAGALC